MDARFNRIEEKLDKIMEVQTIHTADLQEHMRRTEIAEQNIDNITSALRPIQDHVALVKGSGVLLISITTVLGSIAGIWLLFKS